MQVTRELMEQMLALGSRRIVGVSFAETPYDVEPTATIIFIIDAPDAPADASDMSPSYRRKADGSLTMVDPGWS